MSSDAWRVVPNAERSDIEVSDDSVFASLARQTRVGAYDRPR